MRVSKFLGLVALPLAAAVPAATHHHAPGADALLSHRAVLTEASQFNFQPFNLTNIGMQCARPSAADIYACELRCKLRPSLPRGRTVSNDPFTEVDWHDPNSVRQNNVTSCSCIYKWSWDGKTTAAGRNNTYSDSYTMCYEQLPVYFEMRMAGFNSSEDFAVEIAHRYHDSECVHPAYPC